MNKKTNFNKSMVILLISTLIIHLATYLIVPVLPIILKKEIQLDTSKIGIVISVNFVAALVGSILGGYLTDRVKIKYTIIIGALIQAIGTFFFAFSNLYIVFIILSFISGFGHGMNAPSVKAAINLVNHKDDEHQTNAFSVRGVAANTGLLIAGITIFLLIKVNYKIVFYLSSILLVLLSIIIFIFMSKDIDNGMDQKLKIKEYKLVFNNKPFILFLIIILIVNLAYSQLQFLLPLRAEAVIENINLVGLIWVAISLEVILLQTIITKYMIKKLNPLLTLFIAMIFFSTGILLIGFSHSLTLLLISALVFTIGQMLISPTIDNVTGKLANQDFVGGYYSISHLLTGLGSSIGTYISGIIINYLGINTFLTPWLIISISLVGLSFLILLLKYKIKIKKGFINP